MSDDRQFLMALYTDDCAQARHHEMQRSSVANLVVLLCGALVAFITYDKDINMADAVPSVLITALGIYGALFSAKQYERARRHGRRAAAYRERIANLCKDADIRGAIKAADDRTKGEFPLMSRFRLYVFWISLNGFIILLGIVLLTMALR